ncbi:MAG: BON domain-containing protein [Granulosicoccus sp.]|nr:BON domain-containing protein [Granulosicoccus sp.]
MLVERIRVLVFSLALVLGGCGWDGGPLIEGDIGTVVDDTAELSVKVKKALRNSPETATSQIKVTTVSSDSVKLSGFVSNSAIMNEAERVASQVSGVRFVVNSLIVR